MDSFCVVRTSTSEKETNEKTDIQYTKEQLLLSTLLKIFTEFLKLNMKSMSINLYLYLIQQQPQLDSR